MAEFYVLNNTRKTIIISDLEELPSITGESIIDLLEYTTSNKINASSDLEALLAEGTLTRLSQQQIEEMNQNGELEEVETIPEEENEDEEEDEEYKVINMEQLPTELVEHINDVNTDIKTIKANMKGIQQLLQKMAQQKKELPKKMIKYGGKKNKLKESTNSIGRIFLSGKNINKELFQTLSVFLTSLKLGITIQFEELNEEE